MSNILGYLGVSLFGLAGVTMFLIVRDVLPLLSPDDQTTFVIYAARRGRPGSGRAIINAWNQHIRAFPQSKKRFLVIAFVIAGICALLTYPLSRTFAN